MFVQKREKGVVNKNWLLLNSQSKVDQVANPAMLKNIRKAASAMPDLPAPTWKEI